MKAEYKEIIDELSINYGMNTQTINSYLEMLLEYPFIKNGDEEKMLYCLEAIISDRASHKVFDKRVHARSLEETFNEIISRIYRAEADEYLNDTNSTIKFENLNDFGDSTFDESELEYQGYGK